MTNENDFEIKLFMEDKELFKQVFPLEEEVRIARTALCYFGDFVKIANNPIWKKLTVRGVKLSYKNIKRAYKEMENIKFRGDIIDYICYVSLNYALSFSMLNERLSSMTTKETMNIMRSFLNYQTVHTVLSCRLILKDETYLDDVFNQFKVEKGEFYDGVKKFIYEKINEYLKVEPGVHQIHHYNLPQSVIEQLRPNKSKKLKRS